MNKIRLSILITFVVLFFGCTPHKEKTEIKVQLSEAEFLYQLSNYTNDSLFLSVFNATQNSYNTANGDFVDALGKSMAEQYPDYLLASVFNTFELRDKITFQSTNDEVIRVLKDEVKLAKEATLQILKKRIELAQTSNLFNKLEVLVQELPEKSTYSIIINRKVDKAFISELLQKKGHLGFWETHDLSSIWEYLDSADKEIGAITNNDKGKSQNLDNESIIEGNSLFSILMPAVLQDGTIQKGCLIGYSHEKDTALVNQYLKLPSVRGLFPRDLLFMWSTKMFDSNNDMIQLFAIKNTRDGQAPLTGDCVVSAKANLSKQPITIHLTMNAEGANIWSRMTNYNIDRQIAIVMDNVVYTAPFVYSEIKTGESEIAGGFNPEEANNIAAILSAGPIPNITVKVLSINE